MKYQTRTKFAQEQKQVEGKVEKIIERISLSRLYEDELLFEQTRRLSGTLCLKKRSTCNQIFALLRDAENMDEVKFKARLNALILILRKY